MKCIHIGPRRSPVAHARSKEKWSGDPREIKVGSLVATLAEDDDQGCPFHIVKVIDLERDPTTQRIILLKVHW